MGKPWHYYNEWDKYAAQWLHNLISAGHLPDGEVDERSIVDVSPEDLAGFAQCHFFAGIGGWPLALKIAGWPLDRPVWTGSCPCQPFSGAGKQLAEKDERHVWPAFLRLIAEWDVPTIFGEQVASKLGRGWLAGVRADLEALGYAVGAADLCAAGIGAPHIRQRLYWLADSDSGRQPQLEERDCGTDTGIEASRGYDAGGCGTVRGMADADGGLARHGGLQPGWQHGQQQEDGRSGGVAHDTRGGWQEERALAGGFAAGDRTEGRPARFMSGSATDGLGNADNTRSQGRLDGPGEGRSADQRAAGSSSVAGFWPHYDIVHCTDGKARRFEPGSFPLAHGVSSRVGRLRAYGNAIVPQLAAEFIWASQGNR